MTYRIALDVEGVLSDTHRATANRSDMLDHDMCPPDDWEFPSDEHYKEFMHVSSNLWHNHNTQIPPMVDDLWYPTQQLSMDYTVDIVTHRQNVDEMVVEWLEGHSVVFDDFHVSKGHKTDSGDYHIHIDDSPSVARDVLSDGRYMVLIDAEYNQSVGPHNRLERVDDVAEAADHLSSW